MMETRGTRTETKIERLTTTQAEIGAEPAAAIRERLLSGLKKRNGGYDEWLKWCDTLYEPDAHYHVYGHRLKMEQYKTMMKKLFEDYAIELGELDNMLIQNGWCAIRYSVKIRNLHDKREVLQHTMEFVKFKENPDPAGVRVVEGWALSDKPLV